MQGEVHGSPRVTVPEDTVEGLKSYMEGPLPYSGPILLFAGLILGLTSGSWGSPRLQALIVTIALVFIFIGGFLEFYSLLVAYYISRKATGLDTPSKLILYAAMITGLYFILVGIILASNTYRRLLEVVEEKPIEDTMCSSYSNSLLHIITLGLSLALLQRCVFLRVSRILATKAEDSVPPEGLGSHGYEGVQYTGCGNVPV